MIEHAALPAPTTAARTTPLLCPSACHTSPPGDTGFGTTRGVGSGNVGSGRRPKCWGGEKGSGANIAARVRTQGNLQVTPMRVAATRWAGFARLFEVRGLPVGSRVSLFNPLPPLMTAQYGRIRRALLAPPRAPPTGPAAPQLLGYGPVQGSHTSSVSRIDVRPAHRRLEWAPSGTVGDVASLYGEVGAREHQRVEPASPRVLCGWYGSVY